MTTFFKIQNVNTIPTKLTAFYMSTHPNKIPLFFDVEKIQAVKAKEFSTYILSSLIRRNSALYGIVVS